MNTRLIDGHIFEKMIKNGYANLRIHEQEINDLNVFPVADGDTGSNMRLTVENGIRGAEHHRHLGHYLKELSSGMLLGARGNSGVILSQMFKGMYNTLSRTQAADIAAMRNALIGAYRTAYSTVAKPVEGTILTVSREGIEHIRTQLSGKMTQEELLSMYIAEMRKSLLLTPELLPCLKEAGVVDSGAVGYITLFEGMLKMLFDEKINWKEILGVSGEEVKAQKGPNLDYFDENSPFIDGYCMEFILQRMKSTEYNQLFHLGSFTRDLDSLGESVVAVEDGLRVKVHVHTKKPGRVIALAQEYGEFLTFKLENMQLQHNEHDDVVKAAKKGPRRKTAVLCVCDNDATRALFSDFQCDCVLGIDGSTNVSVQDLLTNFDRINADSIIVLPNNKNGISTAEQAAKMFEGSKIYVLPTKSIPEGYMARAGNVDFGEADVLFQGMLDSMEGIDTLAVVKATRAYESDEFHLVPGDFTGILNDDVASKGDDYISAFINGLKKIDTIDEKYLASVFAGVDVTDEERDALVEAVEEEFPDIEVCILDGGSKIYHWLSAIS